ncbi:MAG: SMI1/KNR4 family protein [Verrucomicrobia bacterium]|nr:SMI1/KNR4 family protein [Verrucomicrobiota bacterium]
MNISGITYRGENVDDEEILGELPPALLRVLTESNGFILHNGALHVRGAVFKPGWHSFREAMDGPNAFHTLYEVVRVTDIPFAEDQLGDQFLLREERVFRLSAETGDVELLADSLDDFFERIGEDIEGFLNIGLEHAMQPGQLLLAYPPFVFKESGAGTSLKPVHADQVIRFHADLARQIRDDPDGEKIDLKVVDG